MSPHTLRNAAAALAALIVAGCTAQAQTTATVAPPPAVDVAPVSFQTLRQWDDFTGRLEPVDRVALHPRVAGEIVAAPFEEGARVRKGQLLFQIDPRPFQAEVDRLRARPNGRRPARSWPPPTPAAQSGCCRRKPSRGRKPNASRPRPRPPRPTSPRRRPPSAPPS